MSDPTPRQQIEEWLDGPWPGSYVEARLVRAALEIIDADHKPAVADRWCKVGDPMHGGRCLRKLEHEAKLWQAING